MGKKRRILLAALLIAALGGLVWWLMRPREPNYKGKSLSAWVEDYGPGNGPELLFGTGYGYTPEAEDALRHIGTNAIPILLRLLRTKDAPLKARLVELLDRQGAHYRLRPDFEKREAACDALRILGAQAAPAVPKLIRDFEHDSTPDLRAIDAYALGCIGPTASNAVPALMRGLACTNAAVREDSIIGLALVQSEPRLVVPQLAKITHSPDRLDRYCAIRALGNFGTNARSGVSDLMEVLEDGTRDDRKAATNALKQIDPEAAARMGIK